MADVVAVCGAVPADQLGLTSMHEHLLADLRCYLEPDDDLPSELRRDAPVTIKSVGKLRREVQRVEANLLLDDASVAAKELSEFADLGGRTVVELSVPGLRLDVEELVAISESSGVNVVVGTGLYVEASWPQELQAKSEEQLADWMTGEIEDGIEGTGVRAGHIGEIGVSTLSERERCSLRAACRAGLETGLSITVHPGFEPGVDGRAIADIMEAFGMPPERVILAHADSFFSELSLTRLVTDRSSWGLRLDYHRELLSRGYNLAIDCFGHEWASESQDLVTQVDWQRLAGLVALVGEGYAGQLVLGCDVCLRVIQRAGGGTGYAHLIGWVLPMLHRFGVGERQVRLMMVENPARLLAPESSELPHS